MNHSWSLRLGAVLVACIGGCADGSNEAPRAAPLRIDRELQGGAVAPDLDSITRGAPRIVIDTTQDRGAISRDLYGVNLEPTAQSVPEVQALAAQYPIIRFPGGDGSAQFLWSDGDRGPCGDRWTWGTIADLAVANRIGLVLEANLNLSSPADLANWVANARARGLRVPWVNIGNEVWGDFDANYRSAADYARELHAYAAAIRARAPGTRLAASFGTFNEDDWNREVVRRAGDVIDALDVHFYPNHREHGRAVPSEIMAEPEAIPQLMTRLRGILRDEAPARASQIEVVIGEYDCAEDIPIPGPVPGIAYAQWGIANAVCFGGLLGELMTAGVSTALYYGVQGPRNGALQGHECEPGDYAVIRPKALAQQLYREHFGDRLVAVTTRNVPTYHSDGPIWWDGFAGTAPYVRAYASLAGGGSSLRVIVLNRHETEPITVTLELRGFVPGPKFQIWELAGDSVRATNENVGGPPDAVRIVQRTRTAPGSTLSYAVPAHSVSALAFPRAR